MTRNEALQRAVRLWGKQAAVRDNGHPTSEADRAAARIEYERLRAMPAADRDAAQRKEINRLRGLSCYYRYTVGTVWSIGGFGAFSVMGEGDTWDAAFAKAEKLDSAVGAAIGKTKKRR